MTSTSRFLGALAIIVAALGFPVIGGATPSSGPTATFGIYPETSTPLGVSATQPDPNAGIYVYTYTVNSGDALNDSIPLDICLDALSNPGAATWSASRSRPRARCSRESIACTSRG